jgi:hypothetical protein
MEKRREILRKFFGGGRCQSRKTAPPAAKLFETRRFAPTYNFLIRNLGTTDDTENGFQHTNPFTFHASAKC